METRAEIVKRMLRMQKGYREDLHIAFRSCWEANYARTLVYQGIKFRYEPQKFELALPEEDRVFFRGRESVRYIPDFLLTEYNKFVEIKGFMTQQSAVKLKAFREQHPEFALEIIGQKEYQQLAIDYRDKISNDKRFIGWETDPVKTEHERQIRMKEDQRMLEQERQKEIEASISQSRYAKWRAFDVYRFRMSKRCEDLLRSIHVKTIGDLTSFSEKQLRGHNNCGKATVEELKGLISELGFSFRR